MAFKISQGNRDFYQDLNRFFHLIETQTSSTLLLEFCKEIHLHHHCRDYVVRMSIDLIKENCFSLKTKKKEARIRLYLGETKTFVDDANDTALLVNTTTESESLLQSLEQAGGGIGLHVSANKIECMCFKREGAMSTLNGCPLKLVNKFTYLGRSAQTTESDVNL